MSVGTHLVCTKVPSRAPRYKPSAPVGMGGLCKGSEPAGFLGAVQAAAGRRVPALVAVRWLRRPDDGCGRYRIQTGGRPRKQAAPFRS